MIDPDTRDQRLLRSLAAGDTGALHTLVQRHYRRVFGYAYTLCRDYDVARELAGETFVRLHNTSATLRTGGRLRPWLYRAIRELWKELA